MTYYPKVFVILVNWNHPDDTVECLKSIWLSDYPNFEIIVIDNGSKDDSMERLQQIEGRFILLSTGKNLGFTGGNNFGMRYALSHGADYVMLLNNDTIIADNTIRLLVQEAETNISVGIVSPKILFYPYKKGRELIWFAGSEFNRLFMTGRMIGYKKENDLLIETESEIPFASGCAMLIRRSVIEKIGYLDDSYFLVFEDLDYSLRSCDAGYKIKYLPKAIVWHKESISAGGHDNPMYVYYQTRNLIFFQKKWTKGLKRLIGGSYIMLFFLKRTVKFAFQNKRQSIMGILYGLKDGILNRIGCCEIDF